jgi:hypothetical protein
MSSRYENITDLNTLADTLLEVLRETEKIKNDDEWYAQYLKDIEEFTPYYNKLRPEHTEQT